MVQGSWKMTALQQHLSTLGPLSAESQGRLKPFSIRDFVDAKKNAHRRKVPRYPSVAAAVKARRGKELSESAVALLLPRGLQEYAPNDFSWRNDPRIFIGVPTPSVGTSYNSEANIRKRLSSLKSPVIVILGNNGWRKQFFMGERLKEVQHAKIVTIEGME